MTVAQPQTMRVLIQDDCHNPLTKSNGGVAQVTFNNRDKAVDLVDKGAGIWEGTWKIKYDNSLAGFLVTPITQSYRYQLKGVAPASWVPSVPISGSCSAPLSWLR